MTRSRRPICSLIAALALTFAGVGLAGCSQILSYPVLPVGDVIGQETLTPAQQDAEIKELSEAQVENTAQAGDAQTQPKYIPASVTDAQ